MAPIMKISVRTSTVAIAAMRPNFPISSEIVSSFYCNGVTSVSYLSFNLILPIAQSYPTTITMNFPSP